MGGCGSGEKLKKSRMTTDHLGRFDIREIVRKGLLINESSIRSTWKSRDGKEHSISSHVFSDKLVFFYNYSSDGKNWEEMLYPVYLDSTNCYFGGKRIWLICPGEGCNKRVAILYTGKLLLCRQCHNLVYASQFETKHDRIDRKAEKIRMRLGWRPGILNGEEWKPKRMHWKTFWKLHDTHKEYRYHYLDKIRKLL